MGTRRLSSVTRMELGYSCLLCYMALTIQSKGVPLTHNKVQLRLKLSHSDAGCRWLGSFEEANRGGLLTSRCVQISSPLLPNCLLQEESLLLGLSQPCLEVKERGILLQFPLPSRCDSCRQGSLMPILTE